MLELIDFDLDATIPEVAKGVNTLEHMGYHYGWLQAVARFKGATMDDIPAYKLSGKSGLHTYDDLISYAHQYLDSSIGVIIKDADGEPTGILFGIDEEQSKVLGLW